MFLMYTIRRYRAKAVEDTMGFLFTCDRREIGVDECVAIYRESYKLKRMIKHE